MSTLFHKNDKLNLCVIYIVSQDFLHVQLRYLLYGCTLEKITKQMLSLGHAKN